MFVVNCLPFLPFSCLILIILIKLLSLLRLLRLLISHSCLYLCIHELRGPLGVPQKLKVVKRQGSLLGSRHGHVVLKHQRVDLAPRVACGAHPPSNGATT